MTINWEGGAVFKIKTQNSVLGTLIFVLINQRPFQVNGKKQTSAGVSHTTGVLTVAELRGGS